MQCSIDWMTDWEMVLLSQVQGSPHVRVYELRLSDPMIDSCEWLLWETPVQLHKTDTVGLPLL